MVLEIHQVQHIEKVYPKQPSLCSCMNMRRASRAVTLFYDGVLKPSGLTVTQLSLLRNLETLEQATIGTLAKKMRIDRTTLNRNLKPLADSGHIIINPGTDSRTRQIVMTEKGKDALVSAWSLWGEAQDSIKTYMGEEDLDKLMQLLSKLEAIVP